MKIIRTDLELETPHVDATLRAAGHTLVLLPDGIPEDTLITPASSPPPPA
jgi:D-3-phosphoglycerate dehydrogenase